MIKKREEDNSCSCKKRREERQTTVHLASELLQNTWLKYQEFCKSCKTKNAIPDHEVSFFADLFLFLVVQAGRDNELTQRA